MATSAYWPASTLTSICSLTGFSKAEENWGLYQTCKTRIPLRAFTLQPQTLELQLHSWLRAAVGRDQDSHRVYWQKDVSRAHSLGKHHQAVENPEIKWLSAEGGMKKKPTQTRALHSTCFFHMHLYFFNSCTQGPHWKIKYFTWHFVLKRGIYIWIPILTRKQFKLKFSMHTKHSFMSSICLQVS